MSLAHGSQITRDGLVLQLDAANAKSYPGTGTAWNDLSGLNNHATIYNSPIFSEYYFQFDGVDDYAEINPALKSTINAAVDFTVISFANVKFIEHVDNLVGWGNANVDGTGYSRTFGQYAASSALRTSYIGPNFGSAELLNKPLMYSSRYNDHVYNSRTFGSVTANNTTDFTGSTTNTWKNISTSWPITIAKTSYFSRFMQVDVSAILMYNRLLSDTELLAIYEAHRGRYGI